MPTVGKKKYPYTKAGKAAAAAGKAAAAAAKKKVAKKPLKGGMVGVGAGKVVGRKKRSGKWDEAIGPKGKLERTPAMLRKQKTAIANARKRKKAGKGLQK